MTFRIVYNDAYKRKMTAILFDSRAIIPAIATVDGFVLKAYTDAELLKVSQDVIPYTIETDMGNLAAYFTLKVNRGTNTAVLFQQQVRPAFVIFNTDISQIITNFINGGDWQQDFLF